MRRCEKGLAIGSLVGGLLGGIVASSLWHPSGAASADSIKARRFELVDSTGRLRARLGFENERESPSLKFMDLNGTESISLSIGDASPELKFKGPDGKPRILLLITAGGEPQLQMGDGSRGTKILLGAVPGDTQPNASRPDWVLQVNGANARSTVGVLSNRAGDVPILSLDPTSRAKMRPAP